MNASQAETAWIRTGREGLVTLRRNMTKQCALCESPLSDNQIIDDIHVYCCHGCHAVHQILRTKEELHNFREHPVFQNALRSGLISNPDLLAAIQSKQIDVKQVEVEKLYLEIGDMWCPSCAEVIHLSLMQQKGVISSLIDYSTDLASITFSARFISKEQIFKLIESFGYKALNLENSEEQKKINSKLYLRFIVAAFCSLNVMMFSYPLYASYFDYDPLRYGHLFAWGSFFLSIPVVTFCFWPILKRCLSTAKLGIYGMEALVAISVVSSFTLSLYELLQDSTKVYFDTLTVIIAFVLLGKIMEMKAKFSAKNTLFRLHLAVPRRVRKQFPDGTLKFVSTKELAKGDVFAVFQAEKIALDGIVSEGEGTADESLMTGESLPVQKKPNSKVLGGSILQHGRLFITAESGFTNSALTRIIQMVESHLQSKPRYIKAIDPIIAYFVPFVLALALFSGLYSGSFIQALSVLLIACPCAIGIAVPLAESYLMSGLAKIGAIVKNSTSLAFLGKETVFVFDKTGTVTEGKFHIAKGLENLSEKDLKVLKAMTSGSSHLIASAISKSIAFCPFKIDRLEEITGKGLKAFVGSDVYHLGSFSFLKLEGVDIDETESSALFSTVYYSLNRQLKAVLFLGDKVREEVPALISDLKPAKTILLSGDCRQVVSAVAKNCSFDAYYAEHTPLMKAQVVEELQKQGLIVCMVGDGINDAPAMTKAHVSISVISATDISIQVSDLLLTTDNLLAILKIRSLGKFGAAILKQNLFWAFFYNMIGIALATFGLLSPIFATFAMMISSLIVLYNAKRLYKL